MKVSQYGVFSGPYFPVSGINTGKCGPEKTPCLDNFYAEFIPEAAVHKCSLNTFPRKFAKLTGKYLYWNLF